MMSYTLANETTTLKRDDEMLEADKHRILVVDDDPTISDVVARYLQGEGYEVDIALDGAEALDCARQNYPDLVVLDLMLPKVDGLEVCRQLRAQGRVPIIMLTAKGEETDMLVGLSMGADDYMTVERAMGDLRSAGQVIETPQSLVMADETPEPEAMEESDDTAESVETSSTMTPEAAPEPESTAVPTMTPEPTAAPTEVPTVVAQPTAVRLKMGNFQDADSLHRGSGEAVIYRGPDGSHLLRLENFKVTNGPNLHVILTPRRNPTSRNDVRVAGYADLGRLKGNVGNQNYTIPDDVDISSIESIVIYCLPFHVIFSVASLQETG